MDSYREYPSDFDLPSVSEASPAETSGIEIGSDERRMHVRAYNYWVSLLNGRDYPSIEDLEPGQVEDFAANSVLLDFTAGRDNPATPYVGASIREECGLDEGITSIADVPSRSLLSRLTDHYMQIIANRAPIGFEAEFVNQRSETICYRGILMPFSSDGDTIDFIYGVINWKSGVLATAPAEIAPVAAAPADEEDELILDQQAPIVLNAALPQTDAAHVSWDDGPLHDPETGEIFETELGLGAGLADHLWAARESVDLLKGADDRTRSALYRALARAYDFALASEREPEDYAELLEESGVKAQARAPMTPIVKLVFGVDYDKSRLTEFAAALSFARRQAIAAGAFLDFIESQAGGLKALVAAERQARKPEPKTDTRTAMAKAKAREAKPIALDTISSDGEFALVLARRCADGGVEAIALVEDDAMIERAIRRANI